MSRRIAVTWNIRYIKVMTITSKFLDDLARKVSEGMPAAVTDFQHDIEQNVRGVLQNTFAKLNLVTREEFDVQTKVLARTRQLVTQLEERVRTLEAHMLEPRQARPTPESDNN